MNYKRERCEVSCRPLSEARSQTTTSMMAPPTRILAHRLGRSVRVLIRNGHDFADRFPLAVAAIKALPVRSCVLDGEAIVCDESGLTVFDLIHGRHRQAGDAIRDAGTLSQGAPSRSELHSRLWRRRRQITAAKPADEYQLTYDPICNAFRLA